MNRTILTILLGASIGAAGACAEGESTTVDQPTARELLRDRTMLTLYRDASNITLKARFKKNGVWQDGKAKVPLANGYMTVETDERDQLRVVSLRFALGDIKVSARTLPPNGLHLTNIVLRTELPTACHLTLWSSDDEGCYAGVDLSLILDMAVVIKQTNYQLPSMRLTTFDSDIAITGSAGSVLDLATEIEVDDSLWYLPDVVELYDLRIEARGTNIPLVL
jgi:hypothetical protein